MKKNIKLLALAVAIPAAVTAILALFNKAVDLKAAKNPEPFGSTYKWKYGNINYEVSGSGKPLMLIHSLYAGSSLYEWKKAAEKLSEFYTVYNIDLPGYGHSDKPKMTYSAFTYAALLNDFAKDVIKKPVYVIAANGSANSAIMSAKNYETIEKLMVISPQTTETELINKTDKLKCALMELPVFGTAFYNLCTTKLLMKKSIADYGFFAKENIDDDFVNECMKAAHCAKGNERYAFAALYTKYMDMDVANLLTSLNIPVAVCWGEENIHNPIKNMEKLEELAPNAQFMIFEKTRSYPHIENASEFANASKDFFESEVQNDRTADI